MIDRAHIRFGKVIKLYAGEAHRIQLADPKKTASPIPIGLVKGPDRIVPFERVHEDTATGDDTISGREQIVTKDGVTEKSWRRDCTAKEKKARGDKLKQECLDQLQMKPAYRVILEMIFLIMTNKAPVIKKRADFNAWVKDLIK